MKKIKILVIFLLLAVNFLLLPSKGTGDVINWQTLTGKIISSKPDKMIPGCLNYDCPVFYPVTYPPGHFLITYFFASVLPVDILGALLTVKLSILFFYIISPAIIFLFLKNFPAGGRKISVLDLILAYLLTLSFILNAQGLGYTDFFTVPFLVLGLLFLFKNNYFLAGLFYSAGALVKWQPAIIAPLLITHILKTSDKRIKSVFLFIAGILLPVFMLLPLNPQIFIALKNSLINGAILNPFMSAGLNFQFVTAFFLNRFFPGSVNPLPEKSLNYIFIPSPEFSLITLLPKIIFGIIYFFILARFAGIRKSSSGRYLFLLETAWVVYLLYFFVSSAVHENHLFLALIFAFLSFAANPGVKNRLNLYLLDFLNFVNLFIFYGYSGKPPFNLQTTATYSFLFAVLFSFLIFPVVLYLYFFPFSAPGRLPKIRTEMK